MVHDSFGTFACDIDALREHTTREFVGMYEEADWLSLLLEGASAISDKPLPNPPPTGDLDLNEVLESEYLFG